MFLCNRGQTLHQQAGQTARRSPVQDVSHLSEGARVIGTVAVTGATGFIGRHLTADLVERGVKVRAVVRPDSPNAAPPGADIVRAPLKASALAAAFAGIDAVVHLAGVVSAVNAETYAAV